MIEGEGDKAYWTKIGAAWRHDDGKGFNISLRCLPLNGQLIVRELGAHVSVDCRTISKLRSKSSGPFGGRDMRRGAFCR
ncbi:hypothetical protein [Bradyrhizobium australiense]|uniref:Uncharacterized protein n=1 Tax=Bradyrhizobium australiense TaxID=2721161 RepID=A0A7Y4LZ36_9BRAD|nr:hypothetical protein [Bradyrhizobium australiense]NOJ43906.1 hypothetical protein [Bradyrhizobium australiense]